MRKLRAVSAILLAGCLNDNAELRTYDVAAGETVKMSFETDDALWVTFEAPKDLSTDQLSKSCPILEDSTTGLPMCAELAQIGSNDLELARIRGVIGGGLKFVPYDGQINLTFTNFSSRDLTYEIRIE